MHLPFHIVAFLPRLVAASLRVRLSVLGLALLAGAVADVRAQDLYEGYTGFTVDTTPVLPAAETHPSLYFHADDLDVLRARRTDPDYLFLWGRVERDAKDYLDDDPAAQDANDRPRMAKTLAFYWLMEGDEQARDRAIEALLLAFEGVPQTGEKPYDEIYRATWLQNYAAAYDWLHDQLTPAQDSTARARLAAETQYLRDNLTEGERLAPRPHNHRSKPAWAIATAALAMAEHPQAADWLAYALGAANTVTKYMFSHDGIYRESGHYWMYSAVNFIPFLWHYYNVSGVDLFDAYRPAFEWPVRVRMGRGWIPNLEDGYVKPAPTHLVARAYLDAPADLHTSASWGHIFQWNWATTSFFTIAYTGATNDVTWELDAFILYDDTIEPIAPDASPTQLLEGGQVVFRNRWTGGPGQRYLLFNGAPEADNHQHPDQLSFVIEADDAYLVADAGYGEDGFSDSRRRSWYVTPKAHNVVTFDDDDVLLANAPGNTPVPTPYFLDTGFFDFAEKRADGFVPYVVSLTNPVRFVRNPNAWHRRAVAFVGERYFVVADLLADSVAHTYRLYLHGRGSLALDGAHAAWTAFDDRYGEAARLDAFLLPTSAERVTAPGYISLFKDARRTDYVEMRQEGTDAGFLQVLVPSAPDAPTPDLADLSAPGFQAARLVQADTADVFLLQPTPAARTVEELTVDATFAWVRRVGGELQQLALREATHLRTGDVEVTVDAPAVVALDLSRADRWEIHATAPDARDLRLAVHHPAAASLGAVYVNGRAATFDRADDGAVIVSLTAVPTAAAVAEEAPRGFRLEGSFPNPFSEVAEIVYHVDTPGAYRMEVYDVLGRRVATLVDAVQVPGTYRARWDGQGRSGEPLPAGLYFCRLVDVATGRSAVRTMSRLR